MPATTTPALLAPKVTLYFSDEEIWREIEYDPKAHIQTRIEWRQKFLRDAAAGETST
jgi:cell fate regulator YaaT (PSP1 superfamily)